MSLISGCGGGYDIFSGIPLYLELLNKKNKVFLLNLSFTIYSDIYRLKKLRKINEYCFEIDYSKNPDLKFDYFPEYYLSKELKIPIYLLKYDHETKLQNLVEAYKTILEENCIETIYLIDAGCDVLLSGNESELGTPLEDITHLKVVSMFPKIKLFVGAVGMNCDVGKKQGYIDFEERLQFLENNNIILSKKIWSLENDSIKKYKKIVYRCNPTNSIVQTMICSALDNHKGGYVDPCLYKRIKKSKIELGPITKTFVLLDGKKLIKTIHYFDNIKENMNIQDIDYIIGDHIESIENI